MTTIALTGATGMLGSALLYELLEMGVERLIVLGGRGAFPSLHERLVHQLQQQGTDYLGVPASELPALMERIDAVQMRLDEPQAGMSPADRERLAAQSIDAFVNIAGLTTFKQDDKAAADTQRVNVAGLSTLLEVLAPFRIGRFIHISSAYSSGRITGTVKSSELDPDGTFANPYQRSKMQGELLVREWEAKTGTPSIIVRPATIGGWLDRGTRGSVTKFDVYLGWAKSLLRLKGFFGGGLRASIDQTISFPMRLSIHPQAGLNIVPVDWAARALAELATMPNPGHRAYHLANHHSTPHALYVSQILDAVKLTDVQFVPTRPSDYTMVEQLYYDRLGWVFADYVEHPDLVFDRTAQSELEARCRPCPPVQDQEMAAYIAFAAQRNFGLDLDR